MTFKLNVYEFYNIGYTIGFVPNDLTKKCFDIINKTDWLNDGYYPNYAKWSVLPNSQNSIDDYYEEIIRGRMSYGRSPVDIKNLANEFIDLDFFDTMKDALVKKQHKEFRSIRNIKPYSFGLWNGQENLNWHNDFNDTTDFFILIYFNEYETWDKSWGGQIHIGKKDEDENIIEVGLHYPINATFICVNNSNPLLYHKVSACDPTRNRYTFAFRYKID